VVGVWSASDDSFIFVRRSGWRGYLGFLFNNCLFPLGFCCTLELYDKDITTTVGQIKSKGTQKLEDLNLQLLHLLTLLRDWFLLFLLFFLSLSDVGRGQ